MSRYHACLLAAIGAVGALIAAGCGHSDTSAAQPSVGAAPAQPSAAAVPANEFAVKTTQDNQPVSAAGAVVAPEPGGPVTAGK